MKKNMPWAINNQWISIIGHGSLNYIDNNLYKTKFSKNKDEETLSCPLAMSNLITTLPQIIGLLIPWIIYWAIIIFSEMFLPLAKPDWLGEIRLGRLGESLRQV